MTTEQIAEEIEKKIPGSILGLAGNMSPCAQKSLIVNPLKALDCAAFLKNNLSFDFLSNVSGVDWLPESLSKILPSWGHSEADVGRLYNPAGFLEAVYHLFSTQKKNLSCVLRLRTADRAIGATIPSLTPVWKSAEFQEREIFDLYGIRFEGHPDLRRIMMWDEFEDHPMRKDFAGMPSQLAEKESAE